MSLKSIGLFLWAPTDIIKEEFSITDNARLKQVEKHWKKCFHFGPNSTDANTKTDPSSNYKLEIPG
jgi:hypothetical protein